MQRVLMGSKKETIALVGIVGIGLVLRLFAIDQKTMWLDEAFSVWMAHHSLPELWGWLTQIDQHPPLYYIVLHFWQRIFGDLQGTVRVFSALCGALVIPIFYATARRFLDKFGALLATAILAISPFHVRFGQETRMYALLTLTAVVAMYFAVRLLIDEASDAKAQRRNWIGLGIAQAALMLTHNTAAVFFPIALNLPVLGILFIQRQSDQPSSLAGLNRPIFGREWLFGQLLALLLWLPWAYPFVIQSIMVDGEFWISPPTAQLVSDTFHNFTTAFLPAWFPLFASWRFLYIILAIFGLAELRRSLGKNVLLISLLAVPIVLSLLVSLRRPIFYERTLIWATLSYYILIAAGIRALGRIALDGLLVVRETLILTGRMRKLPTIAAIGIQALLVAMIAIHSGFGLNAYYFSFEKEDWAKAAAYVAERAAPNELIIFNATWVQLPFEYYFRHFGKDSQLKGLPVDLFDRGILEPKMTEADLPYMHQLVADQEHLWLVYSHDWYTDSAQIIPEELKKEMDVVDYQEFTGLKVFRFEAK